VNLAPAVIAAWERSDFIAACALQQLASIEFAKEWLREAGRKSVNPAFRYPASMAAIALGDCEMLHRGRRVVSDACAPWFDGSAFTGVAL
jgi:hypothetical protein